MEIINPIQLTGRRHPSRLSLGVEPEKTYDEIDPDRHLTRVCLSEYFHHHLSDIYDLLDKKQPLTPEQVRDTQERIVALAMKIVHILYSQIDSDRHDPYNEDFEERGFLIGILNEYTAIVVGNREGSIAMLGSREEDRFQNTDIRFYSEPTISTATFTPIDVKTGRTRQGGTHALVIAANTFLNVDPKLRAARYISRIHESSLAPNEKDVLDLAYRAFLAKVTAG